MNAKKIFGLIVLLAGVTMLIGGFYGKSRMDSARGDINATTGFFSENPVTGFIGDRLHGRVDEYKLPVALAFIGGVVFIIGGATLLYLGKKKKS